MFGTLTSSERSLHAHPEDRSQTPEHSHMQAQGLLSLNGSREGQSDIPWLSLLAFLRSWDMDAQSTSFRTLRLNPPGFPMPSTALLLEQFHLTWVVTSATPPPSGPTGRLSALALRSAPVHHIQFPAKWRQSAHTKPQQIVPLRCTADTITQRAF